MNDAELENLRKQLTANVKPPRSAARKLLQTLTTKFRRRKVSLSAPVALTKPPKDPAA